MPLKIPAIDIAKLKGDASGGLVTAIVSLPGSIAFGILAFSPFGHDYLSIAILSGIYSAIVTAIVASLLGGGGLIVSPKPAITVFITAVVAQMLADKGRIFTPAQADDPMFLIGAAFFLIFLVGIFQVIFGLVRAGSLLKFIPHPVVAGFINSTAILILISQLWPILGIPPQHSVFKLLDHLGDFQFITVAVAGAAILGDVYGGRITKRIPPSLLGLLFGTVVFQLLCRIPGATGEMFDYHEAVIGTIGVTFPPASYFGSFMAIAHAENFNSILLYFLPAAFSIAVLASLDSLLSALAISNTVKLGIESNRMLAGQGAANVVAAGFGGIAGAGNIMRTISNINAGGATAASGVFTGLFILAITLFLEPVLAIVPNAALAGLLVPIAVRLFDAWSVTMLKRFFTAELRSITDILGNILAMLLVIFVAVSVNLVAAVGAGLLASVALLIRRLTKSVIRQSYVGGVFVSLKRRHRIFMDILIRHGYRIHVLELEGSVFFSTSESVLREAEKLVVMDISHLILDIRRVNEIDWSGGIVMDQINTLCAKKNTKFAVAGLAKDDTKYDFLHDMGVTERIGPDLFFPDSDSALQWAEDGVIAENIAGEFEFLAAGKVKVFKPAELDASTAIKIVEEIGSNRYEDAAEFVLDLSALSLAGGNFAAAVALIRDKCYQSGKAFLLAGLTPGLPEYELLKKSGIVSLVGEDNCFPTGKDAVGTAKARIIAEFAPFRKFGTAEGLVIPLEKHELTLGFSEREVKKLADRAQLRTYAKGERIVSLGEKSNAMHLVLRGEVSAYIPIATAQKRQKVGTFGPGTFFGEMMILVENLPRTASVLADTEAECLELAIEDYRQLIKENPQLAIKLQRNVGYEFVTRFRLVNAMIFQMNS